MRHLTLLITPLIAFALSACGPVEIKIGPAEGAKPLNGSVHARIDTTEASTFTCGDVITAQDSLQTYTVTSRAVTGGCEFTFDQDVEVIGTADYESIKDFKAAVHYINRVELSLNRFEFYGDDGEKFELDTRIRDVELWINGEQVLNIDQVRILPHKAILSGEALKIIKRAVKNREACSLHVMAKVTLLDHAVKTGVRCEYESQPTYILSSAEI